MYSTPAGKFQFFVIENEKIKQPFFSWDTLTIYDGDSSTSSMMEEYCGYSIPPSHVSSSNEVLIRFQSGNTGSSGGFQMEYIPIGKKNNTDYHMQ